MDEANDLKTALLDGRARIAVWGSGYVGFTSAVNFAVQGVRVLCHDINPRVVQTINRGQAHIPNLEYWLGFPCDSLVEYGLLGATEEWRDLLAEDIRVHLVAVPTERGGEPWAEPLRDVASKISRRSPSRQKPDLVIVESTLTPNDLDNIVVKTLEEDGSKVGEQFLVGVAPRRDWFHSPEKNLKNLPRIIAGTTPATTALMAEVLGIVCDHLIPASSHRVAELVKVVENSLLHVPAVYAMQLARAYPHIDVVEVLKLASTHWRIPLYYPSMGTGGYCVPVSSKYVVLGAAHPDSLTIAREALDWDASQPRFIAQLIVENTQGPVGMLGITYKGDLKIQVLSPALAIIRELVRLGREVRAFDPYYTAEEIERDTGVASFAYPSELPRFGVLVLVPDHRAFTHTPKAILLGNLRPGQAILDNLGAWENLRPDFQQLGIVYHRIGDRGWCAWAQKGTPGE